MQVAKDKLCTGSLFPGNMLVLIIVFILFIAFDENVIFEVFALFFINRMPLGAMGKRREVRNGLCPFYRDCKKNAGPRFFSGIEKGAESFLQAFVVDTLAIIAYRKPGQAVDRVGLEPDMYFGRLGVKPVPDQFGQGLFVIAGQSRRIDAVIADMGPVFHRCAGNAFCTPAGKNKE